MPVRAPLPLDLDAGEQSSIRIYLAARRESFGAGAGSAREMIAKRRVAAQAVQMPSHLADGIRQ